VEPSVLNSNVLQLFCETTQVLVNTKLCVRLFIFPNLQTTLNQHVTMKEWLKRILTELQILKNMKIG